MRKGARCTQRTRVLTHTRKQFHPPGLFRGRPSPTLMINGLIKRFELHSDSEGDRVKYRAFDRCVRDLDIYRDIRLSYLRDNKMEWFYFDIGE